MADIPLVDLARQHAEIEAEVTAGIAAVMKKGNFIQGDEVKAFEAAFAEFSGTRHAIGVGSGTDAIELAVRALGLGSDDVVIVPANTFIASALGVVRAGVQVRLVDCDPSTYLIDVEQVADALSPDVRAVLPVHLFGQMADMGALEDIVGDRLVIEDAAQSQGAEQSGRRSGSWGVAAATSFYPGKNIGAYGDGGAVVTDEDDVAAMVRALGNWGSDVKYHHPIIGFNSRLDTMQAVVLHAKLDRLADWNATRRAAAERYHDLLAGVDGVHRPTVAEGNVHVWHLYAIEVDRRDDVLAALHAGGIGAGIHYPVPIHLQPAMAELGYGVGSFPMTERAAQRMISLPMFPGITESEQERVVETLRSAL